MFCVKLYPLLTKIDPDILEIISRKVTPERLKTFSTQGVDSVVVIDLLLQGVMEQVVA